jgi:SAM-dependent methyltransferase
MGLYDHPQLYDALRAPDDETLQLVRHVLATDLPEGARSFMDPACGPGNWLLPFAGPGIHLAGNDLSEHMVGQARRALAAYDAEVTCGDMRALTFATGPFDVALEVAGTVSMLPRAEDFEALLATLEAHVRPGGLVLLNVLFPDPDQDEPRPRTIYRLGPVAVQPEGRGWIAYETLEWDPSTRIERVRRTATQEGVPGCPPQVVDEFDLRIWTAPAFLGAVGRTRHLRPLRSFRLEDATPSTFDDAGLVGEQLVVMRRV